MTDHERACAEQLAINLKSARKRRELSQRELAGPPASASARSSRPRSATGWPRLFTLGRLARAMEMDPGEILANID